MQTYRIEFIGVIGLDWIGLDWINVRIGLMGLDLLVDSIGLSWIECIGSGWVGFNSIRVDLIGLSLG